MHAAEWLGRRSIIVAGRLLLADGIGIDRCVVSWASPSHFYTKFRPLGEPLAGGHDLECVRVPGPAAAPRRRAGFQVGRSSGNIQPTVTAALALTRTAHWSTPWHGSVAIEALTFPDSVGAAS